MEKKQKIFLALLVFFLYLIPTFIQYSFDENFRISGVFLGLPRVLSGDEPHYLATIYSIAEDLDLDLENNYTDTYYNNQTDAGAIYSNTQGIEGAGRHCMYHGIGKGELCFPGHPIGMPLVFSIFLFPFANSTFLESAAIYLMMIVSVLTLFLLYKILKHYGASERHAIIVTLIWAFATPIWFYSKSLWPATLLMFLTTLSFYFFFVRKKFLPSSLLMSVAFAANYPMAILAGAKAFLLAKKKKFRGLAVFSIPIAITVAVTIIYTNLVIKVGHVPLRQLDTVGVGNIFFGLPALIFSPKFGLLVFSPILIFSLLGFREFYREHKDEAVWLALSFVFTWLLYSSVSYLASGIASFGPRYFVPFLPLFALPFMQWFKSNKNKYLWWLFLAVLAYSLLLNLAAVLFYPAFWDREVWWLASKVLIGA